MYCLIISDLSGKQDILTIGTYTGNIDNVGSGGLPATGSVAWINANVASGGHPVGVEFYILETFGADYGIIVQRATQFILNSAPKVFTRMYVNGTWSPVWKEL